ncbi:MAG: AMP-binding protein, partial [Burkholderiaceae bacterium]|nr:AMP-binding protein [Burkholderiaceae bacterium]
LVEPLRDSLIHLEHVIVTNGPAPGATLAYKEWVSGQSSDLSPAPTTPDDPCFWLYSSGTTGQSKGTVHLQHDMVYAAETYGKQVLGVQENDICF